MIQSNCCGAPPVSNGDNDSLDYGICPDCGEHCEFIDDEDFDIEDVKDFDINQHKP